MTIAHRTTFARRVSAMRSFQVMDLLDRAQRLEAAGRDIVHMEVGEPDFASAGPILEAGRAAIAQGRTGYTSALGLPALRTAISDYYARWHGVDVPAERIVVTAGASAALVMLTALLVDEGDALLLGEPGYPCNRQLPLLVGGAARSVPIGVEDRWQPDASWLATNWDEATRAVLVGSPANPTGTSLDDDQLAALLEQTRTRGGALLVDEIYQGLTYPSELVELPADSRHGRRAEGRGGTVLALADADDASLYVINSFSKYFGMTGWRIGWLVAPTAAIEPLEKLAQNFWIAPSTPGQYAAIAALGDDAMAEHERRRRVFCTRRNALVPALQRAGLTVPLVPEGAFYVYARLADGDPDSFEFCRRLLEESGVAATPGTDFGDAEGHRHVRFAYTADVARIELAGERLRDFVTALRA